MSSGLGGLEDSSAEGVGVLDWPSGVAPSGLAGAVVEGSAAGVSDVESVVVEPADIESDDDASGDVESANPDSVDVELEVVDSGDEDSAEGGDVESASEMSRASDSWSA